MFVVDRCHKKKIANRGLIMELKEFIKNVLNDVTNAVTESNNKDYDFNINTNSSNGIDFDLAVLLKRSADGKIGAEISVFDILDAGAKINGSISKEDINRIKFRIVPNKNGESRDY